jgi:colicin import membrane protein
MADEETKTAAPAKPAKVEQNGITRPASDTLIGKVWATAEDLSKTLGRPATRAEVREAIGDSVNPATTATQYARWTKFHGVAQLIKDHRKAQSAEAKKASDEAKAADKAAREAKAAEKAAADKAKADKAAEKAAAKEAADKAKAEAKAAADAQKAEAKAAKDAAKAEAKAARDAAKAAKAKPTEAEQAAA